MNAAGAPSQLQQGDECFGSTGTMIGSCAECICVIVADCGEPIADLPDTGFDRIIHHPPTLSFAGELYPEAFYREMHRVLVRRSHRCHSKAARTSMI